MGLLTLGRSCLVPFGRILDVFGRSSGSVESDLQICSKFGAKGVGELMITIMHRVLWPAFFVRAWTNQKGLQIWECKRRLM
jgi:hypothetical protein